MEYYLNHQPVYQRAHLRPKGYIMTQSTFVLPMETIARHTVSVGGSYSTCMNCGEGYLGEAACNGCETVFAFVASEKIGPGVIDQMRDFAIAHELDWIGYSNGICNEMGGGKLTSFDTYPPM